MSAPLGQVMVPPSIQIRVLAFLDILDHLFPAQQRPKRRAFLRVRLSALLNAP